MSQVLRSIDGKNVWVDKRAARQSATRTPPKIVSDTLGCVAQQVDENRALLKLHGISGASYEPDPTTKINGYATYYQLHADSPDVEAKVRKLHRMVDCNSVNGSGAALTPGQLAEGKDMYERQREVRRQRVKLFLSGG